MTFGSFEHLFYFYFIFSTLNLFCIYLYKCFQIIAEIMNQFCHVGVKFLIFDNISQYVKF